MGLNSPGEDDERMGQLSEVERIGILAGVVHDHAKAQRVYRAKMDFTHDTQWLRQPLEARND